MSTLDGIAMAELCCTECTEELVSGTFEDLLRMALLGMTWLRTLADPVASGVEPDIGCGGGSDLDKLGS